MSENNQNKLNLSNEEVKPKPIKERQKITVFKEVDELGLDPYEFRVYGHIARRGNCFASLEKIAATCCMSVRRVQYALKVLHEAGLIQKEKRRGRANKFTLTSPSKWLNKTNREKIQKIRQKVKSHSQDNSNDKEISTENDSHKDVNFNSSDLELLPF